MPSRRLKVVIGLAMALAATTSMPQDVHAGDAAWWLCTGVMKADGKRHVAVSVLEHRANDGVNRNLDVALIKGANIWRAKVYGAGQRAVIDRRVPLVINQGKRTIFRGTVKLVPKLKRLELRGALDAGWGFGANSLVSAAATLSCRAFDDLSLRARP